ncbi:POL4 protein [Vespula squamosa]|uniref:POL4 protein n=1 Tax=Vespula squamosa TaxID=30214 RepID=A0ABD2BGI0_VESSQ
MHQKYYWESMKQQIKIFIQNCLDCQLKELVQVKKWDTLLDTAMFSYNTSIPEGTRSRPHELVFGKVIWTLLLDPLLDNELDQTYLYYYMKLVHRINRTQKIAR